MCASSDSTPLSQSTSRCETRTVLVVDDDPELTALTGAYLGQLENVSVRTSSDPREALRLVDDGVDCVVSDFQMPECDGLTLFETVRSTHPNLPLVLFTVMRDDRIAERARELGATYVRKGPTSDGFEGLLGAVERKLDR